MRSTRGVLRYRKPMRHVTSSRIVANGALRGRLTPLAFSVYELSAFVNNAMPGCAYTWKLFKVAVYIVYAAEQPRLYSIAHFKRVYTAGFFTHDAAAATDSISGSLNAGIVFLREIRPEADTPMFCTRRSPRADLAAESFPYARVLAGEVARK